MMQRTLALFACIAPCWISTPSQSAATERTERDARWVAECKPRLVTDENGVRRYVYAKDDCAGKIVGH